nr:hypothetical protein [uncultured bacterium]
MALSGKAQVRVDFQCSHPWPDGLWGLLDCWTKYEDVGLAPERYGSSERRTFPLIRWNKKDMEQTWIRASGGVFKRKSPWNMSALIFFTWNRYRRLPVKAISFFTLWVDAEFFSSGQRVERFFELCKDLYTWGSMDHGYVAHENEYRLKNSLTPDGRGQIGGANLKIALPGIYWANFFGPLYVKWLGEEKFKNLKTYYKERLPNGGWLFVTLPHVLEYEEPGSQAKEREIISLLGRDAFFEIEDSQKPTGVPNFWEES